MDTDNNLSSLKLFKSQDKKATTAARVLFKQVFLQFGFPSVLLSDRGGDWFNALFQQLLKMLSIDHICTTSRLNGSTKGTHRWLNTNLGIFCEKYEESWEDYLQAAADVHNVTPIRGTDRIDPFLLVFGRRAPSPEVLSLELPPEEISHSKYAAQLIAKMHGTQKRFNQIKADLKTSKRQLRSFLQRLVYSRRKESLRKTSTGKTGPGYKVY